MKKTFKFLTVITVLCFTAVNFTLTSCQEDDVVFDDTMESIVKDDLFKEYCANKDAILKATSLLNEEEKEQIYVTLGKVRNNIIDTTCIKNLFSSIKKRIGTDLYEKEDKVANLLSKLLLKYPEIKNFSKEDKEILFAKSIIHRDVFNSKSIIKKQYVLALKHGLIKREKSQLSLSRMKSTSSVHCEVCDREYLEEIETCEGFGWLEFGSGALLGLGGTGGNLVGGLVGGLVTAITGYLHYSDCARKAADEWDKCTSNCYED